MDLFKTGKVSSPLTPGLSGVVDGLWCVGFSLETRTTEYGH